VMLRTVTPLFHARGDTRTPVVATGVSIGVNLALKALFVMGIGMGVEGLALATALGTWVNLLVLGGYGWQRGYFDFSGGLPAQAGRMTLAAVYAGIVVLYVAPGFDAMLPAGMMLRAEAYMVLLGLTGLATYGVGLLAAGWRR
jgi:putative peptidoglycan lipid II flippase